MKEPLVVQDIWEAILEDKYMWLVIWGEPRCGKSTVALWLLYHVYKDWDMVLDAIIFNLSQLLYKLDHKLPGTIQTRNKLHIRIPILNWDDFGVYSNKAITQYDRGFDVFKGGFDALGTEIAVLISTMVDPREPTQQLQDKYTHEIFIPARGVYKYDKCRWQQDYKGWRARASKDWIETQRFDPLPDKVYLPYDEMRMSLVPDVKQRIRDVMAETQVEDILRRIRSSDIKLLDLINSSGPVWYKRIQHELGDQRTKETLTRLRARSLITPIRHESDNYTYDISDLGIEVLRAYQRLEQEQTLTQQTQKPRIYINEP